MPLPAMDRPLGWNSVSCCKWTADHGPPAASYLLVAAGLQMDVFECQRFDESVRPIALTGVFPGGNVAEVLVVSKGFAVRSLVLLAEVGATRFTTLQRVETEQFAQLQEVGHTAGLLERLVDLL